VRLANAERREEAIVEEALIDTGATWSSVPRAVADELQLPVIGQMTLRTAAGPETFDQSYGYIEVMDKFLVTQLLVTDAYPGVLVGVTTLEAMGWAVDPRSQRLIDSELLLL
jgi:predicted aspartyl protease